MLSVTYYNQQGKQSQLDEKVLTVTLLQLIVDYVNVQMAIMLQETHVYLLYLKKGNINSTYPYHFLPIKWHLPGYRLTKLSTLCSGFVFLPFQILEANVTRKKIKSEAEQKKNIAIGQKTTYCLQNK